jgi:hypothetical protein
MVVAGFTACVRPGGRAAAAGLRRVGWMAGRRPSVEAGAVYNSFLIVSRDQRSKKSLLPSLRDGDAIRAE